MIKKSLEKLFGFLDILHSNKQNIKLHFKQPYDKTQKNINLRQNYLMKKKQKN
jgi:hypothetical protein